MRAPLFPKEQVPASAMRLITDVIDFGDATELQLDGACGSNHTICVELYANKIVDGKVQRVVVRRCRWDRASWRAVERELAATCSWGTGGRIGHGYKPLH
jgi:hypothetical protein